MVTKDTVTGRDVPYSHKASDVQVQPLSSQQQVTNPLPTALRLSPLPSLVAISAVTSAKHRLPLTPGISSRTPRAWSQMRTHRHQTSPYLCGAQSTFPIFRILEQGLLHQVSLYRTGCTWTVPSLSQALSDSSCSKSGNEARILTEVSDLLSAPKPPPFCIL